MSTPGDFVYDYAMPSDRPTAAMNGSVTDQLHIRLFQMSRTEIGPQWRSVGNRDSFWRLYVHSRDGAAVRWRGRRHELGADRVHLIPAWVRFDCLAPDEPVGHLFLHFDLVGLPGPAVRAVFDRPVTLAADRWLIGAADRAAEAAGSDAGRALCAGKALVYAACERLFARLDVAARRRLFHAAGHHGKVGPALRYIDEHFGEAIDNPMLAARCHMSVHHFVRCFGEAVGQTPARYLAQRRVAAAAQWLAFTDQSIERIAARAGFADRFHFSRVFKRHMGTPPATYRRAPVV